MPTQPLPSNSNLDKLRDHAKTVRKWVRAGVPGAVDLVREHHPRLAQLRVGSPEAATFRLSDAS